MLSDAEEEHMNARVGAVLGVLILSLSLGVAAQDDAKASQVQQPTASGAPAITIYNQNFAVVRETLGLNLQAGINAVRFAGITAQVEPDSVILRDAAGVRQLQIWEQNYRNDPVTQEALLSLYEGKSIDFEIPGRGLVPGKVIRAGYVRRLVNYNEPYPQTQTEPVIEMDGKLSFGLPGKPVFPSLTGDTILKPSMNWLVQTDKPGSVNAELSYITGGMSWEADYNLVAPEKGDTVDLVGWVTVTNRSGTVFENARLKLMAGDVNKVQPPRALYRSMQQTVEVTAAAAPVPVSEKAFDEYHLYSLARPTTLHDNETKQVEFVAATGVKANRFYLYDGAKIEIPYYAAEQIRNDPGYGTQSNPKVWVMVEFKNSEENHLGIPLPKGRLRFYRRDTDSHLEFTGENTIDHTPKDETIRLYTGNAFDITGERKRTDYHMDDRQRWMEESFEIKVRNHKKEPVTVRVQEHMYRWTNWRIVSNSTEFKKLDSRNVEFPVQIPADGERVVTYTVHYSW